MSAVPVFLPHVSISDARNDRLMDPAGSRATERKSQVKGDYSTTMGPQATAFASRAAANWQLTDRGIAVVIVIAGVIMTVALVVIGTTALRVTSADYDSGVHTSPRAQH